jgi:hypothetical protein
MGGGNSAPPWWVSSTPLFATIAKTVSNIFSPWQATAAQAQGNRVYQPTQSERQGAPPPGFRYNSSGQLIKDSVGNITDFISENPLLVGGGILLVVVLFIKPPGRR